MGSNQEWIVCIWGFIFMFFIRRVNKWKEGLNLTDVSVMEE